MEQKKYEVALKQHSAGVITDADLENSRIALMEQENSLQDSLLQLLQSYMSLQQLRERGSSVLSSSLQITKKLLCVLLVAFSLVALAVADEVKETISLQDVLEAKRQSYQFAESTQAERSLEKTKASLYPNLSGSSRVTKAMGRDFQLSSSYTLSWNTPIGVNMQLKFVPRPGAQDSAVSFSVSASVWPLMTNSNGLVKLESGKKTLDRAERSDAQKLFNEELSLYQNYVKKSDSVRKTPYARDRFKTAV